MLDECSVIIVHDERVDILTDSQQGVPGPPGEGVNALLPLGTPVDEAVAEGDLLSDTIYKLQGQSNAQGVSIGTLIAAVRGMVIVDMNNDDYTMTDAEANAVAKLVVNGLEGKTLTYPASADATVPVRQFIGMVFAEPGLLFVLESGSTPVIYEEGNPFIQLTIAPEFDFVFPENSTKGQDVPFIVDTFTIMPWHQGGTYHLGDALGVTVTVDQSCHSSGFWCEVVQESAGQVEFVSTLPIHNVNGHTKTAGRYACVRVRCGTNNDYILSGETGA